MTNKLTDDQVQTIKEQFATTLANTLYTDAEKQKSVHMHLTRIAAEENVTEFVTGLGNQVLDVIESIEKELAGQSDVNLTKFIRHGITVDVEDLDSDSSHYHLMTDNMASLNTTKRNITGNTPTSIDVSKNLNVLKTTGDEPFAMLWLNSVQAILMSGGEKEHAGIVTFRDNGMYDIMYANPELGKVHRLIIAMADDELVRFKMVDLRDPLEDYTVDNLTIDVFKTYATESSEIYAEAISKGASKADALLSAGIEGWALNEGLDLSKLRLQIPNLADIRAYVDTLVGNEPEYVDGIETAEVVEVTESVEPFADDESNPKDNVHTVFTNGGEKVKYTRRNVGGDLLDKVYAGIDSIIADDSRLLSIASSKEQNPRTAFSTLVINRINALSPLSESERVTAGDVTNEVFADILPHLDTILQKHQETVSDIYVESTPEYVNRIASENRIHARGLAKLSEEEQQSVYETIASLPALSKIEKAYDDEYVTGVIDNLNRIAPFEYNAEVLVNGVAMNQMVISSDETGDAYRGTYIRNVLLEEYTKLSNVEVAVDTVNKLISKGSSSALFSIPSDELSQVVSAFSKPRTYTVSNGNVVMMVSKVSQVDDIEDSKREINLYSIIGKTHANNIVIVKSTQGNNKPVYTLTSSTTYEGTADVAEYVKSILI